ncbi:hypothetical protein X751_30640 [Mesorhizobium sp. LNJC395A00]|nr:hypothetical protein X751_30640 [Mesorhizobium sp. LNJC395A00]
MGDAPKDFIETMIKAIATLGIEITSLIGKSNKEVRDIQNATEMMNAQRANSVAQAMSEAAAGKSDYRFIFLVAQKPRVLDCPMLAYELLRNNRFITSWIILAQGAVSCDLRVHELNCSSGLQPRRWPSSRQRRGPFG